MSDLVLFGPTVSSYMRTARWACAEKGVSHEVRPVELGSPEHEALHPFRKVPVMRHNNVQLHETSAITRYIDEVFDGPPLLPGNAADRGTMEQWISDINCYIYEDTMRNYALQYIIPGFKGEEPNREIIDAGVAKMTRDLELLEKAYEGSPWIAGDAISLADLFVGPMLATVGRFPEAASVLERTPNLRRFMKSIEERSAYQSIQPER